MKTDNHIKEEIINKAHQLGFQKIGFAEAKFYQEDKERLYSRVDNNYNATMDWVSKRKEERGNILKYFPEVKTVISFGFNYFSGRGSQDISKEFKFSNYAWGDDYHLIIHFYKYMRLQKNEPNLLKMEKIDYPQLKYDERYHVQSLIYQSVNYL